ncbi:hypothetical protein ACFFTM_17230 [Pseudoduganella plicata]|uniref:Histidine kinase n=1 Tax=Pseudoduganella plicata TaxID=321984 RepID=A0AA87YI75_9BURK|nr:hypothetical protein [Pseudoduganella plicata]GGZ09989.1 hypothetical protein GCM10007388_49340 [Pseudoduganella plicata]
MPLPALQTLLLLLITLAWPAFAVAAPRPLLNDYTHQAWTELDGAPVSVTKFAQGSDGWLWIGSPTGLYRYDGVRFERVDKVHGHPLESGNIMGLTTARDGALWVGYRVGGISVFRPNGARTYGEDDGLHPAGVMHLEAAPDGALWAAMRDGVAVLAPGATRFRYLGEEVGLPSVGVFQILFARDGTTWVGTNTGAYFRPPGAARFSHAWPRHALVWLCEAPDGTVWGNDFKQGYYRIRTAPPAAATPAAPELQGFGMRFDRRGTMWLMHPDGIERVADPANPGLQDQRLSKLNGISGGMLSASFEDREGNLWFGTLGGIDRLRPNRLRTMPVDRELEYPALVAMPSGEIRVGDYTDRPWRQGPDGATVPGMSGALTASYTAPDGTLWLGGMEGVQRRDPDGAWTTIPFPHQGMRVHAMQQDRDGALWASFNAATGVHKLVDGKWGCSRVACPAYPKSSQRRWRATARAGCGWPICAAALPSSTAPRYASWARTRVCNWAPCCWCTLTPVPAPARCGRAARPAWPCTVMAAS